MAIDNRQTEWRQGDVFEMDLSSSGQTQVALLITHDCDICADDNTEPFIEFIEASVDQPKNGSLTFGKNPRLLQVEAKHEKDEATLQVAIKDRQRMEKRRFFAEAIKASYQLEQREIVALRRWLAARYNRSAFPNSFEKLLQQSKVAEKIDALAKRDGASIRGIFFDLDSNELIELSEKKKLHELHVYVVYLQDSQDGDAEAFAARVEKLFKDAFLGANEEWSDIRLLSCTAIAEDAFAYSLALGSKPWRSDHRSYAGLPTASHFPDTEA